jgi:hypothetical protein
MIRTTTGLVAVALLAAPLQHPAGAAASRPGGQPSTPALLRAEVSEGRLGRTQADLYLLYALGGDPRLPARFRSSAPWDGTLPLLQVRRRIRAMDGGPARARLRQELGAQGLTCDGEVGGANRRNTKHFHIEFGRIRAGLTIEDYATSLETSWRREVGGFGWAAPPLSSARYPVVVADLGAGLYGFVSSTGNARNNPNTPWNDGDARYSCMALNRDFSQFAPTPAQDALDGTTAHEFNHSIQFGYGALHGTFPHDTYIEGGATWMEDEVFDGSNDNYNYLWPEFDQGADSYDDDDGPYPYWITFRGLTERFGTGTPGGGEQVMEDFWELVSRNQANNRTAINLALRNKGTNLGSSLHAYAIAVKFLHPCEGGYTYPYCFEEADGYEDAAPGGLPSVHKTIGTVGGSAAGSFEPLGLNWVRIPEDAGAYELTLTSSDTGGRFRASAVCDTGTNFEISPFPQKVQDGQSTLLDFDSDGCLSAVAVLTNEGATGTGRRDAYTLATA